MSKAYRGFIPFSRVRTSMRGESHTTNEFIKTYRKSWTADVVFDGPDSAELLGLSPYSKGGHWVIGGRPGPERARWMTR